MDKSLAGVPYQRRFTRESLAQTCAETSAMRRHAVFFKNIEYHVNAHFGVISFVITALVDFKGAVQQENGDAWQRRQFDSRWFW